MLNNMGNYLSIVVREFEHNVKVGTVGSRRTTEQQ